MIFETRRPLKNQKPFAFHRLQPGRTALVLLNWQDAVIRQEGLLHKRAAAVGVDLSSFDVAAEKAYQALVGGLLKECRAAGLDIIHISSDWEHLLGAPGNDPLSSWRTSIEEAGFFGQARPNNQELTLRSTSISPFNSTRIDFLLRNLNIEQILVAGLTTNHEVELTASDARDRGYEVFVVEDCCAALSAALHDGAVGRLRSAMIPVGPGSLIGAMLNQSTVWPEDARSQSALSHPILVDDPIPQIRWQAETEWDGSRAALVTVDMQFLNAHPDWGVGRADRESGAGELDGYFDLVKEIIPRVRQVQELYRAWLRPLIHFRTACQRLDEQDSGRGRQRNRDPMAGLESQEAQFLEEVSPLSGELVLSKTSWGAFNSTEVDLVLRRMAVSHLTLVGVVTNGCVEMAARDALDRGYRVTVVTDATTARTASLHADALHRLEICGAKLVSTSALAEQTAVLGSSPLSRV